MGARNSNFRGRTMASLTLSTGVSPPMASALRSSWLPVSLRKRAAFFSRMTGAYDSFRVKYVKTVMMPARMAMSQYTQRHPAARIR